MKNFINHVLDFVYPRICVSCEDPLTFNEKHLCLGCLMTLPKTDAHLTETESIERKFWGKINVQNTYSFLRFTKKGKVQNILHALKYKNKPELAEYLGKMYGNELKNVNFNEKIDLLIGIPLHKEKLKMRGYNQADHIAKGLSESLGVPYSEDVMVRNTFTMSQTKTKSRFNRFKNIEGVFGINDLEAVKDKRIALVDDVLTTGSTLEVAGEVLIEAGCKELYIITLAAAV